MMKAWRKVTVGVEAVPAGPTPPVVSMKTRLEARFRSALYRDASTYSLHPTALQSRYP